MPSLAIFLEAKRAMTSCLVQTLDDLECPTFAAQPLAPEAGASEPSHSVST